MEGFQQEETNNYEKWCEQWREKFLNMDQEEQMCIRDRSSIVTAAVVSATGIIGFVGLLVPHVVRLFTGPKHRVLMPVSLIFGGTFLILCDTAARSLITQEIPVGIITAACGGPFFLYLLWKSRRGGAAG